MIIKEAASLATEGAKNAHFEGLVDIPRLRQAVLGTGAEAALALRAITCTLDPQEIQADVMSRAIDNLQAYVAQDEESQTERVALVHWAASMKEELSKAIVTPPGE